MSNAPSPKLLPSAPACINANPIVNAGLAIKPSKPPLSFQDAAALSKSTPILPANFCHQFNWSCWSPPWWPISPPWDGWNGVFWLLLIASPADWTGTGNFLFIIGWPTLPGAFIGEPGSLTLPSLSLTSFFCLIYLGSVWGNSPLL